MKYNISTKLYLPPNYDTALDGLRGIAIIAVVLYHNFSFINLFSTGWLGVDLFFVLSGFLITRILLASKNNKFYFRNFYAKRVLRIFPLYFSSLILFLHILPKLINFSGITYYQAHQWYFYCFVQNWLFSFNFPGEGTSTILQHYWSLAVEEQYYLIWPIIIYIIKKPQTLIRLLILILIGINVLRFALLMAKIENFPYTLLFWFSRIDGLCVGSLLAFLVKGLAGKRYLIIGISATFIINLVFVLLYPSQFLSTIYLAIAGFTTFSILFAALIYLIIKLRVRPIRIILESRVLKSLGKISFGLYIFHYPVHLLLKNSVSKYITSYDTWRSNSNLLISITTTLVAVLLSIISYYSFEKKFLSLKKYFVDTSNS